MESNTSIIVANWNTRNHLLNCLASVCSNAPGCETIVVDNGSTDGSADAVQSAYPRVRTIRLARNQGYAKANMAGFRSCSRRYALFLNSDTVVSPDAIPQLIHFMENEPRCAACGPRLVQPDGNTQPFAFGHDPTLDYLLARAAVRLRIRKPLHDWNTGTIQQVDWVSGACLMTRRSAMEQVGGFDEAFFMYFEDNDLCLRLRQSGWRIFYNPRVSILHLGGASLSGSVPRGEYYYRSLRQFYSKHYPAAARLALRMLLPVYVRCFGGPGCTTTRHSIDDSTGYR